MGSSPLITVPLPTITGREKNLEKAVAAYESHANVEVLLYENLPGCGAAWAEGANAAKGEFVHFGADDVEMHPGWWEKTVLLCELGFLPAPRVLNTDGSLQSCGDWGVEMREGAVPEFTRGPFVSREQWKLLAPLVVPFLEQAHYFTDNIISWAGRKLGMETVVCRRYEYTHHLAGAGRLDERMATDRDLFLEYIASH